MKSLDTPQEAFNRSIEELIALRDTMERGGKPFDPEIWRRAVTQAQDEFARLTDKIDETDEALEKANETAAELGMTFSSAFEEAILSGNKLRDVLRGLAQDLLRVFVRKNVTEKIAGLPWGDILGGVSKAFGFATGGVMSGRGPIPLRRYAAGGIAGGPQLALFGEGSMNEAYVPLPDGRRIPVKLESTAPAISVTVNTLPGTSARVRQEPQGLTIDIVESFIASAFAAGGSSIPRAAEAAYGLRRGG